MTDSILNRYFASTTTTQVPFPAPEPVELLIDTYPTTSLAYSFRKLRDAYSGSAVRIRRSSDNAEADIGFSGIDFDTAAAAAHIGGGTGFIVTWYDQSSNGIDLTQATAASQPTYSAAGMNSLPTAVFDPNNSTLNTGNTVTAGTNFPADRGSLFFVTINNTNANFAYICRFAGGAPLENYITGFGSLYLYFRTELFASIPGGWFDNDHILEFYRDSGDVEYIVIDGATLTSGAAGSALSGTANPYYMSYSGNKLYDGNISEHVIWITDLGSTVRAAIRADMSAYWGTP